jgi:hypothetical protein
VCSVYVVHFHTIIRPGDLENIRYLRTDQMLGDIVPSSLFLIQQTYDMRYCQITRVQIRVNVPSMKYTGFPFARVSTRNIKYDMILVGSFDLIIRAEYPYLEDSTDMWRRIQVR